MKGDAVEMPYDIQRKISSTPFRLSLITPKLQQTTVTAKAV